MPQINVTEATVINEADLTSVTPVLTDTVHLTRGRSAPLSNIKTALFAGESTDPTNLNVPTPSTTSVVIESSTGSDTTIPEATITAAGVLGASDKIKLNAIPVGGYDGSETIINAGTNITRTGSGTSSDPYIINSTGGSSGSQSNTDSLFIDTSGTTILSLVKDTLYEVQTSFTGNGNNLDLDGTNLTNGDIFSIANNTGIDLDVRAVTGTIGFSEITNPLGSGSLVRMEHNTVREFRVKEAGFGTFHYPVYSPLLDEDDMVSDSNTMSPTQQSVKAYVDANSGSVGNSQETLNVNSNSTTTLVPVDNRFYRLNKSGIGSLTTLLTIDNSSLINGSTFYLAYDGFGNSDAAVQIDVTAGQIEPINIASDGTSSFIMKRGEIVKVVVNNTFLTVASLNQPLLDEDDLVSNSSTQAPTQQSVKAYVDANAGGGSTAFVKSKIGNTSQAQIHSDPTSAITYNVAANTGTLTIPAFGDISSATIPIISGTDYTASGDFTLIIKFTDNSVNTWATGSITDFDLYVPQFKFYDIGGHVAFQTGDMNGLNAQADAVDPTVEFGNGEVRFKFTNASTFGSFPQMFVQLQFPKI